MSDRQNDVVARIDTETAKCICGRAIPENGPSLDYCSLPCQNRFFAGPSASGYENHDAGHGTPDGRTINADVNNWFQQSSTARPDMNWASAAEFHSSDAMHQRLGQEAEQATTCHGPTLRAQSGANGETRIMWVQDIADPNAPTRAELDAGVTIGILDEHGRVHTETPAIVELEWFQRSLMTRDECARALAQMPARVASVREAAREWENAYEQLAAATLLTPEELGPILNRLHDMGNAIEPPVSGEEFRRRALEARQNRGTGPDRRDNRRWRNQQ